MNALEELSAALASVSDPGRMRKFLEELHTPAELKDMDLRWRLLKMLDRGHPQREIARRLKISLCKITRGSKILKHTPLSFHRHCKQNSGLINTKDFSGFLASVIEDLAPVLRTIWDLGRPYRPSPLYSSARLWGRHW